MQKIKKRSEYAPGTTLNVGEKDYSSGKNKPGTVKLKILPTHSNEA